jgi:hypothetical protein
MERYRLPIPWDATPVSHTPPLRRIDPSVPQGYPLRIPFEAGEREPDPRKYEKVVEWTGEGVAVHWALRKEFH